MCRRRRSQAVSSRRHVVWIRVWGQNQGVSAVINRAAGARESRVRESVRCQNQGGIIQVESPCGKLIRIWVRRIRSLRGDTGRCGRRIPPGFVAGMPGWPGSRRLIVFNDTLLIACHVTRTLSSKFDGGRGGEGDGYAQVSMNAPCLGLLKP